MFRASSWSFMIARLLPLVYWMRVHNVAAYTSLRTADEDINIVTETGNFDILELSGTQQREDLDSCHKENYRAGKSALKTGQTSGQNLAGKEAWGARRSAGQS